MHNLLRRKISSFLVVENVELTNEDWVKSALRSIVCQVTPFALKINAILAFGTALAFWWLGLNPRILTPMYASCDNTGALIGGQRQWADIFFDKWRRLLTEFFDSSDYEVAEGMSPLACCVQIASSLAPYVSWAASNRSPPQLPGLTVMSYYLFYLGDLARSRCFGESAAQISVRYDIGSRSATH
jgi:hypothetical protein